jgi:hypothetical protein
VRSVARSKILVGTRDDRASTLVGRVAVPKTAAATIVMASRELAVSLPIPLQRDYTDRVGGE